MRYMRLPENGALSGLRDSVVLLVKRNNLGQPKISDFHQRLTGHKDISCCKVSVHITQGLQVLHPLGKLKTAKENKMNVLCCAIALWKHLADIENEVSWSHNIRYRLILQGAESALQLIFKCCDDNHLQEFSSYIWLLPYRSEKQKAASAWCWRYVGYSPSSQ